MQYSNKMPSGHSTRSLADRIINSKFAVSQSGWFCAFNRSEPLATTTGHDAGVISQMNLEFLTMIHYIKTQLQDMGSLHDNQTIIKTN